LKLDIAKWFRKNKRVVASGEETVMQKGESGIVCEMVNKIFAILKVRHGECF